MLSTWAEVLLSFRPILTFPHQGGEVENMCPRTNLLSEKELFNLSNRSKLTPGVDRRFGHHLSFRLNGEILTAQDFPWSLC